MEKAELFKISSVLCLANHCIKIHSQYMLSKEGRRCYSVVMLLRILHCFFPWNLNGEVQTIMYFSLKYAPCLIAVSPHLSIRLFKSPNSLPLNTIKVMCLIFRLTSEGLQGKIKAPALQQWCWWCPGKCSSFAFVLAQALPMKPESY